MYGLSEDPRRNIDNDPETTSVRASKADQTDLNPTGTRQPVWPAEATSKSQPDPRESPPRVTTSRQPHTADSPASQLERRSSLQQAQTTGFRLNPKPSTLMRTPQACLRAEKAALEDCLARESCKQQGIN